MGSRQGRLWGGMGGSDSVAKAGWAIRWDVGQHLHCSPMPGEPEGVFWLLPCPAARSGPQVGQQGEGWCPPGAADR